MALAPFDVYCSESAEQFQVRRWVGRAILLSVVFHLGLLVAFRFKTLDDFPVIQTASRKPVMTLWRLADPPVISEEEEKFSPDLAPPVVRPIPVPMEKPGREDGEKLAPVTELALPATESPKTTEGAMPGLGEGSDSRLAGVEKLNELANGLMAKGVAVDGLPEAKGPPETSEPVGSGSPLSVPGQRTLDEALARMEPVAAGDSPIGISGGALFAYDSYELRPEAIDQLRKLGDLIHRNPGAIFSIEGHTDAIGSPEYNQTLSEKRAQAVKEWLVQFVGISPDRIQTLGRGSSQLRVPATGSVEEQQPNRRVEIVIKGQRQQEPAAFSESPR